MWNLQRLKRLGCILKSMPFELLQMALCVRRNTGRGRGHRTCRLRTLHTHTRKEFLNFKDIFLPRLFFKPSNTLTKLHEKTSFFT